MLRLSGLRLVARRPNFVTDDAKFLTSSVSSDSHWIAQDVQQLRRFVQLPNDGLSFFCNAKALGLPRWGVQYRLSDLRRHELTQCWSDDDRKNDSPDPKPGTTTCTDEKPRSALQNAKTTTPLLSKRQFSLSARAQISSPSSSTEKSRGTSVGEGNKAGCPGLVQKKATTRRRWSPEEHARVFQMYKEGVSYRDMAEQLSRTYAAITMKSSRLGAHIDAPRQRRSSSWRKWSREEDAQVLAMYKEGMKHRDMAKQLSRTPEAVSIRSSLLGAHIHAPRRLLGQKRRWTPAEDAKILDLRRSGMALPTIAAQLSRSYNSVTARSSKLRRLMNARQRRR